MNTQPYSSLAQIESLIRKFLNKTLPKKEWTHNAHLTTGLYFVAKYGPDEAMDSMRHCISTYNESVGGINSDTAGYHETITQFWIWLLNAYWETVDDKEDFVLACNALLASQLADKEIFFKFYTRELLFSKEARKNYIAPDVVPLNKALIVTII